MAKLPCNNGKWSLGHYSRLAGEFTYTGTYDTAEQACAAVGMKAWSYDPVAKKYVPYNPKFNDCRAECAISDNSYLIENTYTVAFRHKPLKLTSQTAATLPKDRNRTTIGVGETVTVTANQPVTWEVRGSLLSKVQKTASSIRFTASDQVGNITITAKTVDCGISQSIQFSVIAPSGIKFVKKQELHVQNILDAGFIAHLYLLPDTVNFYNVQIRELDSPAIASGSSYRMNGRKHGNYQNGHSNWMTAISYKEQIGTLMDADDFVYYHLDLYCQKAILPGTVLYRIPYEWKLGNSGNIYNLNVIRQFTEIKSDGYITTTKGDSGSTFHYSDPTTNPLVIVRELGKLPQFISSC